MKLKDYTISEYKKLKSTVKLDVVLNYVKPVNLFFGKQMNIDSMPYMNVKHCMKLATSEMNWNVCAELFEICFEIKNFDEVKILEFFQARNFLIVTLQEAIKKESILLSSLPNEQSMKWEHAGIKRLEPYNDVISLDRLAQRYNLYPFDLGRKPYSEIIYLMAMVKVDNEINIAFQNIK